jgi:hypothetical protein
LPGVVRIVAERANDACRMPVIICTWWPYSWLIWTAIVARANAWLVLYAFTAAGHGM